MRRRPAPRRAATALADRDVGPGPSAGPGAGGGTPEPAVAVRGLGKRFRRGDGTVVAALDGVTLDVEPGEFLVLLGPSGCGKTTLLRSVAGLDRPDTGHVRIGGRTVFSSTGHVHVPAERRRVSMIFQSYALWPHMSASANVAYPLRVRNVPKAEIADRVHRALSLVDIPELARQFPGQMSGGQQQRVALARAVVTDDRLVLFDEPLSNVDAKVRAHLRVELLSMQRALGFAALYVTHDQTEAMELGHRIAVMKAGRLMQVGSPREVYDQPTSRYVANFIGTTNELTGTVSSPAGAGRVGVTTALGPVEAVPAVPGLAAGDAVVAVFRPEACRLATDEPAGPNRWRGRVEASLFSGSHTEYEVQTGPARVRVWRPDRELLEPGTEVWLSVAPAELRVVPADDDEPERGGDRPPT